MEYKLTKAKFFLFSCLFFILGIGLRSYFDISFFSLYIILIISAVLLILAWSKKLLRLAAFGGLFICSGVLRYNFSLPIINNSYIAFYNNSEQKFAGIVDAEPDVRDSYAKLTVASNNLVLDGENKKINGQVLVKTALYPEYQYGDELEINCRLVKPDKIEDFDYDKYLSRYDIYSLCFNPKIKIISHNQGSGLFKYLLIFKNYFIGTINKILPEPQASFLAGLLIGAKRSIADDLIQAFNRTGTTHIIAISGYNITIIAAILLGLAKSLGISRKKSFWFIVVGILFFVVITGASASVVRAAVMGILVLLVSQIGRVSRITNALVLAAVLMLLVNPKILAFDAGFQLSFLATMGLVYLSPILEQYFIKWPEFYGLKNSLLTTISAIIFTTPLILYQFGRLSIVAPLVNIIVLPVVPWAMALGFAAATVGMISWHLGWILGWFVWLVLSYIILIVKFFGNLSRSSIEIKGLPWWTVLIGYGLIGWWVIRRNTKTKIHESKTN